VQDRQHRAVTPGIEEANVLPGARQRARLGLAVADDCGHNEVWVVEGRAERVREYVAELSAFMDRARGRNTDVAWDATRGRELTKESPQAGRVQCDLWGRVGCHRVATANGGASATTPLRVE
jgi:hypothetical protein